MNELEKKMMRHLEINNPDILYVYNYGELLIFVEGRIESYYFNLDRMLKAGVAEYEAVEKCESDFLSVSTPYSILTDVLSESFSSRIDQEDENIKKKKISFAILHRDILNLEAKDTLILHALIESYFI